MHEVSHHNLSLSSSLSLYAIHCIRIVPTILLHILNIYILYILIKKDNYGKIEAIFIYFITLSLWSWSRPLMTTTHNTTGEVILLRTIIDATQWPDLERKHRPETLGQAGVINEMTSIDMCLAVLPLNNVLNLSEIWECKNLSLILFLYTYIYIL